MYEANFCGAKDTREKVCEGVQVIFIYKTEVLLLSFCPKQLEGNVSVCIQSFIKPYCLLV